MKTTFVDIMGTTFLDHAEATAQGVWLKPNPMDKVGSEIFLTTNMLRKIIAECDRLRTERDGPEPDAAASDQGSPAEQAAPPEPAGAERPAAGVRQP